MFEHPAVVKQRAMINEGIWLDLDFTHIPAHPKIQNGQRKKFQVVRSSFDFAPVLL
jgi:hypothetical protein